MQKKCRNKFLVEQQYFTRKSLSKEIFSVYKRGKTFIISLLSLARDMIFFFFLAHNIYGFEILGPD